MNQEKIGKFILKIRKEKNMTQQELANKLSVTDRAVSHWENGRSLPDVSLFKPLCEILDISVNELICGEKLSKDKLIKKSDENIINTINDSNNQKKKSTKIIFTLSIIFMMIIIVLFYYNKNLKVNLVNDSNELYDITIDFIRSEELKENPDSNRNDFNVFYSYYGFGIEKKGHYKYVYMWIYNQSYYLEGENVLAISSGNSVPCKAIFKDNELIKVEYPENGSYYKASVQKMFPKIIATQVLNFDKEKNINKLFNEVADKKNKYYDYLNMDMSKIKIEDISYNDLIFTIHIGNNKECIPIRLSVYKNNKYILYTAYKACKSEICTHMLSYTKRIEGKYDYDIIQILKHSMDANNMQFSMDNLPKYEIYSGSGYSFITDDDNKYLNEFLESINVDLNKCADPDYNY